MPLVLNWNPVRVACGSTTPAEMEVGALAMATIQINGTLTLDQTSGQQTGPDGDDVEITLTGGKLAAMIHDGYRI